MTIKLVHGLNNSNAVMSDLARALESQGHQLQIIRLQGHDPEQQWPEEAYQTWMQQLQEPCDHVIGFSLGAVLLLSEPKPVWKNGAFFSPPLCGNSASNLLEILLPRKNWPIISLAPQLVRAKRWNSTSAYHGLFDAMKVCRQKEIRGQLIVGDPRDRLLDWKQMTEKYSGNDFLAIDCQHPSHHISTRKEYMSDGDWTRIIQAVHQHFSKG